MATHSRILAWRTPCSEEPGGLQSMGSQRVGCDCSDLAHVQGHEGGALIMGLVPLQKRKGDQCSLSSL